MTLTAEQIAKRDGRLTEPPSKWCEWCGDLFFKRENQTNYDLKRTRFCSRRCGNAFLTSRSVARPRPSLIERFEDKFMPEPNSGCWLWIGALVPDGYGSFGQGPDKTIKAHRMSWILYRGDPGTLHVLHRCDNRLCVNPDHLFLGSNADNVADKMSKGRAASTLTRGNVDAILDDDRPNWAIAADYGVVPDTIGKIRRGETWAHISETASC